MSVNHLNMHLPDRRLIACFHRKAASSSLRDAFLVASGAKDFGGPFKAAQRHVLWIPPKQVRALQEDANHCVVAFGRHPEERVRSAWSNSIASCRLNANSWDDYVRKVAATSDSATDKHLRGQVYAMGTEASPGYAFRLEDMDWQEVQQKLLDYCGLELPKIRRLNVSKSHDAPWTDEQRELIRERYADDYKAFGYA
jgi:hypothetical protein